MARPQHEDTPLYEPSIAWIRHLRAGVTSWQDNAGKFIHPPRPAVFDVVSGLFKLPADVTTVDEIILTLYPQNTGNHTIRYWLFAGACGELFNVHTLTQDVVHALTANTISCIDLVALFPAFFAALTAGDNLLIRIATQVAPGWITIYGFDLRYS